MVHKMWPRLLAAVLLMGLWLPRAVAQSPPSGGDVTGGKPLHRMTEAELAAYITALHGQTSAPERIGTAALRWVDQPYALSAPMFGRSDSDCVTFVEHTLAMAMAESWESYHLLIARLRYKDGELPFAAGDIVLSNGRLMPKNGADERRALLNRNLSTIAQWIPNNAWCLVDITKQLGSEPIKPWIPLHHIDRPRQYYAKQGLTVDLPDKKVVDAFVPREAIPAILPELQTGDVVLVIVGTWDNRYCDHMGIVVKRPGADAKPTEYTMMVHSAPPRVRQEPIVRFLHRFPDVEGLKFLRLKTDAESAAQEACRTMATRLPVPPARAD